MRLSDRDGSGGALDRSEPINSQIGHSDLVSVPYSLEEVGRPDRRGWHPWVRTECLAFGVPMEVGTAVWRLALAVADLGGFAEESQIQAGLLMSAAARSLPRSAAIRGLSALLQSERYAPGATCRSLSANSPCRFSDQNARYGMLRPCRAVRGPPTPHPVPCRVKHLLQNTVHSSSSHLSPQPTSPAPFVSP